MPVRVFLSSKMKEFRNERAAIVNLLAAMRGFQVNAAEDWGALSGTVENIYRGDVRECHIYVGLFGRVYSAATNDEYEEACKNPYRQKLIYLKQSKNIDTELQHLIKLFMRRHKPYTFKDLWDLLPHVPNDLDRAVQKILDQNLELGSVPPVSQSGERSVSLEAWKNKRAYFAELYQNDVDLTTENLGKLRAVLADASRQAETKAGIQSWL